jgi:hypothetical protein
MQSSVSIKAIGRSSVVFPCLPTKSLSLVRALVAFVVVGVGLTAMNAQVLKETKRPPAVPSEYLVTPFGYFHPSCITHLTYGDTLKRDEFAIQHSDGSLDSVSICNYPHYDAKGNMVSDALNAQGPQAQHPELEGWVEDYNYVSSVELGYLYATWTVPPVPASENGQILYFFPGLEDIDDVVSILQPVLAWNDDNTSSQDAITPFDVWSIASWNCCITGPSGYATVDESTPVTVNVGDTIAGEILSDCAAGTSGCQGWYVYTFDFTSDQYTELSNAYADGQIFNWAFAGVMEDYNVTTCGQLPSNGSITFNDVALYNYQFDEMSPAWTQGNYYSGVTPQCNYGGSTSSNSATLNY